VEIHLSWGRHRVGAQTKHLQTFSKSSLEEERRRANTSLGQTPEIIVRAQKEMLPKPSCGDNLTRGTKSSYQLAERPMIEKRLDPNPIPTGENLQCKTFRELRGKKSLGLLNPLELLLKRNLWVVRTLKYYGEKIVELKYRRHRPF